MPITISGTTGVPASGTPFLVGQVAFFAMNTAPSGFLACSGQAVSRTTYSSLFAQIGTTYGVGDGSTTFNLPDLRGEFVRCWDNARGVDSGRAIGTSQTDAFQGHYHNVGYSDNSGSVAGSDMQRFNSPSSTLASYARAVVTDGTNGTPRTAAETRPRNVALLAAIFTGV